MLCAYWNGGEREKKNYEWYKGFCWKFTKCDIHTWRKSENALTEMWWSKQDEDTSLTNSSYNSNVYSRNFNFSPPPHKINKICSKFPATFSLPIFPMFIPRLTFSHLPPSPPHYSNTIEIYINNKQKKTSKISFQVFSVTCHYFGGIHLGKSVYMEMIVFDIWRWKFYKWPYITSTATILDRKVRRRFI